MPVSPHDFALYSRMTGSPVPTDAMSRMQMAPDVYKFTKDFAKKPNILEKSGNLLKNIANSLPLIFLYRDETISIFYIYFYFYYVL